MIRLILATYIERDGNQPFVFRNLKTVFKSLKDVSRVSIPRIGIYCTVESSSS